MGCELTDRQHGYPPKKSDHKQQEKKSYKPSFPKRLRNIDTIENGQHDTRPAVSREKQGGGRLSQILININQGVRACQEKSGRVGRGLARTRGRRVRVEDRDSHLSWRVSG
jgi:hypothetical protein